jgi:hypothetical protein
MTKDEAMKLALDALEAEDSLAMVANSEGHMVFLKVVAITAIKEALAQPEQEPVAWMCSDESLAHKGYERFSRNCQGAWNIPVYTTPPQRTWIGLNDTEWSDLYEAHHDKYGLPEQGSFDGMDYERAIEAKLKEKNYD